jgi:glycosyltransferase involved in cell wall biosynthesis
LSTGSADVRVLIFAQYFPPEIGAGQTRVHTFAAGLAARGHDVQVICEAPNHPQGVFQPGYGEKLVDRRRLDGFDVAYVKVMTGTEKTFATRLGFYGSYAAGATAVGLAAKRPDVIFASSPPLPDAVPAAIAAVRHRCPWVLDVRDLWPEAAVAMGQLGNPRVVDMVARLARLLYKRADAITTVTEPFREQIAAQTPDPEKIELLPNGTTRFWLDAFDLDVSRAELGLPADGFLWTYAGNMSAAQGLASAVEAARLLGDGFHLLMVGEGPEREQLERQAADAPDGSVLFRRQVEVAEAARLLRASDALLVQLADQPALRDFVPSKLYDCCAVGRPVIVAAGGEPTRLVGDSGAGLPVPPGDAEALAAAVRRLRDEPLVAGELAAAGREFAAANVRERQVERLDALLGRLADR